MALFGDEKHFDKCSLFLQDSIHTISIDELSKINTDLIPHFEIIFDIFENKFKNALANIDSCGVWFDAKTESIFAFIPSIDHKKEVNTAIESVLEVTYILLRYTLYVSLM